MNAPEFKKIRDSLSKAYWECRTELKMNGESYKPWFISSVVAGAFFNSFAVCFAAGDDIESLATEIASKLYDIYDASFIVITVLAAISAILALVRMMDGNPQKAEQGKTWLLRIIACYVGINLIGLVTRVINNTVGEHRAVDYLNPTE